MKIDSATCARSHNAMDIWSIKVEPDDGEQIDATEDDISAEPENGGLLVSGMDIEEHPVKLEHEEEQSDPVICGLPAPDREISDHEQPREKDNDSDMALSPSLNKESNQYKCEDCSKTFNSQTILISHIWAVHAKLGFYCDVCNKRFAFKSSLDKHSLTHLNVLECPECQIKFHNVSGLYIHIQKVHRGVKHKCLSCDKIFNDLYKLERHRKFVHNIEETVRLECDFCQKKTKHKKVLERHIENFHLEKFSYCGICQKNMKNKGALQQHQSYAHGNVKGKQFPCRFCNKVFKAQKNLNQHKSLMHSNVGTVQCNVCHKTFRHHKNLYEHARYMHGNAKLVQCNICQKTFKQKNLYQHIRLMHGNYTTAKCSVCHKNKKRKGDLCDVCDAAFKLQKNSNQSTVDSKPSAVECSICNKMLKNLKNLHNHIKIMHTQPVQCNVCQKTFKSKKNLYEHLRNMHKKTGPVQCNTCYKTFTNKRGLCIHIRRFQRQGRDTCITSKKSKTHMAEQLTVNNFGS